MLLHRQQKELRHVRCLLFRERNLFASGPCSVMRTKEQNNLGNGQNDVQPCSLNDMIDCLSLDSGLDFPCLFHMRETRVFT